MKDLFTDVKALIFDGYIKETVKLQNLVIVIRTLSLAEENFVIESYEHLPDSYNLLAAAETIKKSIHTINGCRIDDKSKELVEDWPKQLIIKLFNVYLLLSERARIATKQIDEFVKTNDSKLKWSVLKLTKTSLNSAVITGNPELESKGLSYPQQVWIYLNEREEMLQENKLNWSRVEYMTESICAFINPKAMRQIQHKKQMEKEEEFIKQQKDELKKIQKESKEKIMIENTADDLFDSLERRKGESAQEYRERVGKAISKAWEEDEHDRIVREYEEYEFARKLRIQKENARRSKLLHEQKKQNAFVIDLPESKIPVGFHQVSTLGSDDEQFEILLQNEQANNKYYIKGVDYSEIIEITSFSMLKNRDRILDEVVNEPYEVTTKWIEHYIESEKEQSETDKEINKIQKEAFASGESSADAMINRREQILARGKNKFESQQEEMIRQIQSEHDEIQFGG